MTGRCVVPSPVGNLLICEEAGCITRIDFTGEACTAPVTPLCARCADQLREYFAGTRKVFDLPLATEGTAFRRQVWRALS